MGTSFENTPASRTAIFRRGLLRTPLRAALLAAGILLGSPAHAVLADLRLQVDHDGTALFDPTDGPGLDSGAHNGIVRTHDEFQYSLGWSSNSGESGMRVRLTMPRGESGEIITVWKAIPPQCVAAESSLSADGQVLTCRVPDYSSSGTAGLNFVGRVLGSARNGQRIPAPDVRIRSDSTPESTPDATSATLTVSAAPFYDVRLTPLSNENDASQYREGSGPNGEDGFFHRIHLSLFAHHPNGHGIKGVEQLRPDEPVRIDLDTSRFPASVRVNDWQGQSATGSFGDGCGSNGPRATAGAPSDLAGGTITLGGQPNDLGPSSSTASNTLANGGDCRVASSSRDRVQIALDGVDTSLQHMPTHMANNTVLPPGQYWVANKTLLLWTDRNDYPVGTRVNHTISLAGIQAQSLSGQATVDQVSNNHSFSYQKLFSPSGTTSKYYRPDATLPLPWRTYYDQTGSITGPTNQMAIGQTVGAQITVQNTGPVPLSNVMLCDVIDRTAFDIADHFRIDAATTSGMTISYGARRGGSPYFSSTDTASDELLLRVTPGKLASGTSEYATARCDSPDIVWFDNHRDAENAGGLVYVRGTIRSLAGNATALLRFMGLKLRETWGETIQVLSPTPATRVKGERIPENTILRNMSDVSTPTLPSLQTGQGRWDHLRVIGTRNVARITKQVTDPANTATTPVRSGSVVAYRLEPRIATVFPPLATDVTVRDVLPEGMNYVAGSATLKNPTSNTSTAREPRILRDTPDTGLTTLEWTFENHQPHGGLPTDAGARLPIIEFRARVSRSLPDGTQLRNQALISGGAHDQEADCSYNTGTKGYADNCPKGAVATINVSSPPGFFVEKSTSTPTIEPGDPFDYTVSFLSMGNELMPPNIPDIIDILPFAGDGNANPALGFHARSPASSFQPGAYRLVSVTPPAIDPGATLYFTRRPHGEIHNNPADASNQIPGGATRWCRAAEFGAAGCPANIGESTAVRVTPGLASLRAGVSYVVQMNLESDPVVAQAGNVFANVAGFAATNPASTLQYVQSQADLNVRVSQATGSIGGRIFVDANQNNQVDGTDAAIGGQCVSLSGTNARGQRITLSMRSDAAGNYLFREGAANTVYNSADCSGQALPHFGGVPGGTYTLSRVDPTASGLREGAIHAGTAGGTAGQRQISQITLDAGVQATGYHFTDEPAISSLAGRFFIDGNQNNQIDAGDAGVGGQCVSLTGVNEKGEDIRLSTRTDTDGHYRFADGDAGTVFDNGDCTGNALPRFDGLLKGTYTLSRGDTAPAGQTEGAVHAGTAGGTATVQQITQIALNAGVQATGYHFTYLHRPGRLTLLRRVNNDHGSTATLDTVTLSAVSSSTVSGAQVNLNGTPASSGDITQASVPAGVYQLGPIAPVPGYDTGAWACTINGNPTVLSGNQRDTLTLAWGDEAICEIVYDDQPARLTLDKLLDIRHGRTAQVTDFVLRAEGISHNAPTITGRTGEAAITGALLPAGTFALREDPVASFSSGEWQCSRVLPDGSRTPHALDNGQLVLANGQNVHCTITGTDEPWNIDIALEKSVSPAGDIQPGEGFNWQLSLVSRGETLRAPHIPEIIDILPFNGDGPGNPANEQAPRAPASSFEPGAIGLNGVTPSHEPGTQILYTTRDPREIHSDPRHPSNRLPDGQTRWCVQARFGSAGCPASLAEVTAVRIVPGIGQLEPGKPFSVGMAMTTDRLLSWNGNTFANRASARTVDPASTMALIHSSSNLAVDVRAPVNSLAGRVFVDPGQNNALDEGDWALADQCITLSGQTDTGSALTLSMRTDSEGRYAFASGARNSVYPTADCSGTPLSFFGGLLSGWYALSRDNAPEIAHQQRGAVHAGSHAGDVTAQRIDRIRLQENQTATGYHFTDTVTLPRLTLQAQVTNDDGGSASAADFPLRAHATRTADGSEPRIDGRHGAPAVTSVAVPAGDYVLATDSLPGYRAGTWQCVVDGAAPVSANTLSLSWGNEAVCTLVHDDQAARLTLSHVLDIRHGRPASEPDFVLGATGPAGSTALSGLTGTPALTQARVAAGAWTLSAAEVEGFTHGAWRCTVRLPDGSSTERIAEAGRVSVHGDESVHCSVTYHDAPLLIELTQVLTDSGAGAVSSAVSSTSADTAVAALPEPVLYISPLSEPSRRIAITRGQPATDELRFGEQYAFSVSQTPGYSTKLICLDASQRELPSPVRMGVEDLTRVSCRIERKRIPTELSISKVVLGALRPVAATPGDYDLDYALTVQHTGGDAGVYDLADVPGFDPDVQIVSHAVSLNDTAVTVTPAAGRWPLARQRALAIGASDTWRLSLRIRVPYGSTSANNRCTGGAGHGLFNQAELVNRNDLASAGTDSASNTTRSASACVDTPVPARLAQLAIEKTSTTRSAEIGELVSYRLRIRNSGQGPALSPVVVDTLPRGFTLDASSIRVQGATLVASRTQGRQLRVQLDRIEPAAGSRNNTEVLITYRTRIGVGAQEGDGTNRAHVECPMPTDRNALESCSNESRWKVEVRAGIFSEEACLAGQIFVDCNGNSVKDTEELGIPGVRLYLQNGTWLVSDEQGKYSHCGLRPRTHVLKVDSRTLPRRARLVTSSAQNVGDAHSLFVDARKGMLHRVDFIEGSCSNTVIEQVKARQQQGANTSVQTETGQPALTFDSKKAANARPRQQGTDPAQPAARTRH